MASEQTIIEVNDEGLAKAFMSVQAAANKKADTIKVLDIGDVSSISDYFVVCSGMSDRQVQAIADSVAIELRDQGYTPISMEGYREGRWVIVDFGDVVVHVFMDALRDYYDIESLWQNARRVPIPQELFITSIQH